MPRKKIDVSPEVIATFILAVDNALEAINTLPYAVVKSFPDTIQKNIDTANLSLLSAKIFTQARQTKESPKKNPVQKTKKPVPLKNAADTQAE